MVNKVAWITGAGSGIGEASAIKLSEEGFIVVLSGRTKEALDTVSYTHLTLPTICSV